MSMIPDCRTDDYYNEKYLNEADSQYINGYDFSIQGNIEKFFNNIDNYEDDITIAMGLPEGKSVNIDEDILDSEDIDGYTEEEIREMGPATALLLTIKQRMLEWSEMNRDEMITAMIDGMDNAEYEKIKKKADNGEYKNAIIRRREYMAKYEAGEIPTYWEYKVDETGKHVRIGHCPNGNTITEEV